MKHFTEISSRVGDFDEAQKSNYIPNFSNVLSNNTNQVGKNNVYFVKEGDTVELICRCHTVSRFGTLSYHLCQKTSLNSNCTDKILAIGKTLVENLKRNYLYQYNSVESDDEILNLTIRKYYCFYFFS